MTHPIIGELESLQNATDATAKQKFFKTGESQYGYGDSFLGIRNPVLHTLSKKYKNITIEDIQHLLTHRYHEARHLALLILVLQYKKAAAQQQEDIAHFYLAHSQYINNWDLVDGSCYHIIGPYFFSRDRTKLYSLAASPSMWERRIAIVSTLHFIRHEQFDDTLKLASMLLDDPEDLIHKATGWMLREMGKRNEAVLLKFLDENLPKMPRTALRYAIEKLSKSLRQDYMSR
ncbi:DNA alkylation repair protein [Aliiglaciecola sp. M165]|uniref:DNA alkylation repair protein n=1 Tax=Aliiglaciecola sp. M165 TaxID=2593649 RepID=UPI00117DE169|nr:DNA alkylation repair protein [Aliiglaciecola sp. M165]TRY31712.1 DNA alkylation repair protein [Aliiglaciecola sp. M165]